MIKNILWFRK